MTWHCQHPYKIWPLQIQLFQRYGWCPPKSEWFMWPDHASFRDDLSSVASTYYDQPTYQIWSLYFHPLWRYKRRCKILTMGWFGVVRGHSRSLKTCTDLYCISQVTQTDGVGHVIRTTSGQTAVGRIIDGQLTSTAAVAVIWTPTTPSWWCWPHSTRLTFCLITLLRQHRHSLSLCYAAST